MKVLTAIILVAVIATIISFTIKSTRQPKKPLPTETQKQVYQLGQEAISLPKSYKVTQQKFSEGDWLPNGYCGKAGVQNSCDLLIIKNESKPELVLSSPLQFGILISDAQECFKQQKSEINIGGQIIMVTENYHNLSEITYKPELIDKGENPYDCANVEIKEDNFHHAFGCNNNNVCVWVDKNFGLNNLKSLE